MKPPSCAVREFFVIKECCPIQNTTERIKQILDAEYNKINLKSIIMSLNYFKVKIKYALLELIHMYEKFFDGTLDKITGSDYTTEVKEDSKPYHAKLFPIPTIHELTLKNKVDRLI